MAPSITPTPKQKKKLPNIFDFDDEAFESIREFTGGVAGAVKRDVAKDGAKDLWKQIIGNYEKTAQKANKLAGDLEEGQEFDLTAYGKSENAPSPKRQDIAPGLEQRNYHRDIIRSSERSHFKESRELENQVEQILVEIKRLVESSKVLEAEFQYVDVEQTPVEAGKYHVSFFEWVLITIRNARTKVEDSGAWLATMSSKKGKKNYWAMFKKHGTTFGMSNERSVATQTG